MKLKIPRVIKNWSMVNNIYFTKNFEKNNASFGRRFARQKANPYLWAKSFSEFRLFPKKQEPVLGDLLMNHHEENACTHIHRDTAPNGYAHIRANVMLKKPKKGGDIIIDEEIFFVEPNDLWLIIASLENHGSTPIANGERLIYSFGAIIKMEELEKIT